MASKSKGIAKLTLYSYWRSSCSQRVRIALNLKGLEYEYKAVNLLKGEQSNPEFVKINPVKYVPALVDGDTVVADSLAIVLYLEDKYPLYPLLPQDLKKKALNLQVASIVSSSIQPLQNIPVLSWIESRFNTDERLMWAQDNINKGFIGKRKRKGGIIKDQKLKTSLIHSRCCSENYHFSLSRHQAELSSGAVVLTVILQVIVMQTLEKLLKDRAGKYATGDEVQLADIFLEPQIYAGVKRFQVDMSPYPTLARLHEAYSELPAFQAALPERQPDAPSSS